MVGARLFATARLVIVAAAGVTVCSSRLESVPGRQGQRASGVPAVDSIVEAARSELALPAVSIAIMRGRALLVAKGYGLADRESRVPPSERTIYPIGSLSKQITAAAVMKLAEQGQIRLDEPLATYVPEYRPTSGQMPSIRQLLLQTSGIPAWDDLPDMQDIDSGNADRFTRSRMLDVLARTPALYPAGQWWSVQQLQLFPARHRHRARDGHDPRSLPGGDLFRTARTRIDRWVRVGADHGGHESRRRIRAGRRFFPGRDR